MTEWRSTCVLSARIVALVAASLADLILTSPALAQADSRSPSANVDFKQAAQDRLLNINREAKVELQQALKEKEAQFQLQLQRTPQADTSKREGLQQLIDQFQNSQADVADGQVRTPASAEAIVHATNPSWAMCIDKTVWRSRAPKFTEEQVNQVLTASNLRSLKSVGRINTYAVRNGKPDLKSPTARGTGFLLQDQLLVTALHVVYDPKLPEQSPVTKLVAADGTESFVLNWKKTLAAVVFADAPGTSADVAVPRAAQLVKATVPVHANPYDAGFVVDRYTGEVILCPETDDFLNPIAIEGIVKADPVNDIIVLKLSVAAPGHLIPLVPWRGSERIALPHTMLVVGYPAIPRDPDTTASQQELARDLLKIRSQVVETVKRLQPGDFQSAHNCLDLVVEAKKQGMSAQDLLFYNANVLPGDSGAPVLVPVPRTDGQLEIQIVGLHTRGKYLVCNQGTHIQRVMALVSDLFDRRLAQTEPTPRLNE